MNAAGAGARPLILLGAGGHAEVLVGLIEAAGLALQGVCDPALAAAGESGWCGLPVLGGDDFLERIAPASTGLVLGIGHVVQHERRREVYWRWKRAGFDFPPLVHPAAWVAPSARIAPGVQVMAGAVVQPGSSIGENTIVNTHAGVDHGCVVGADVHIAPGATLCGNVTLADRVFVGAGATVIQGLTVGERALVGAGATLLGDLPAKTRAFGTGIREPWTSSGIEGTDHGN